jgi:hypothetical protein
VHMPLCGSIRSLEDCRPGRCLRHRWRGRSG